MKKIDALCMCATFDPLKDVVRSRDDLVKGLTMFRSSVISQSYASVNADLSEFEQYKDIYAYKNLNRELNKTLFDEIERSHGDYIVIDVSIDSTYDQFCRTTINGIETVMQHGSIDADQDRHILSDFQNYVFKTRIDTIICDDMIYRAYVDFAKFISDFYEQKHIIINVIYPASYYLDKTQLKHVPESEDRVQEISRVSKIIYSAY